MICNRTKCTMQPIEQQSPLDPVVRIDDEQLGTGVA